MPVFFFLHGRHDEIDQLVARRPGSQQPFDVVFDGRKEAGADHPVGGQPNAAAMAAEGLCDGIDEADFARRAVGESPPPRRLAQVFRFDSFERVDRVDPPSQLLAWNDHFAPPDFAVVERHEFDEADAHPLLAGELGEADRLVVVDAANRHAIDLDRAQAGFDRGVNAVQHLRQFIAAREKREAVWRQRIEANGDALQSHVFQRFRAATQEMRVGGHRQVLDAFDFGQALDQAFQIASQHRLAASHAQFIDPEADENLRQVNDLFVGQDLRLGLPLHCLFGHAVEAAEIAAVGDRNAQVANGAAVTVFKRYWRCRYFHNIKVFLVLSLSFLATYSISDNL